MPWFLWILIALVPALAWAQPYGASPLGGLTFNAGTLEEHGVCSPLPCTTGADMWILSWGSDGHMYGYWGDGRGWNLNTVPNSYLGVTQIQGDPPGGMSGVDVYGDAKAVPNWKPLGFVADAAGVQRGFYTLISDQATSSWVMTSSDQGDTWVDSETQVFDFGTDGVRVYGMAQSGSGYTNFPGDVDEDYYYIILGGMEATHSASPDPVDDDLYLARVPKADIATRASYEYVTAIGAGPTYTPTWGTFASKIPIFTDPNGYDGPLSLHYWPALDRWILSVAHGSSALGIFEGETPWGPWNTLYYGVFRDTLTKFHYEIPQKWMSVSGPPYTFWMVFSGWPEYDHIDFIQGSLASSDSLAPHSPTSVQVTTVSETQLTPSWTPPTLNSDATAMTDLAGYDLLWCSGAACTPTTVITLGLVSSYAHTDLTAGTLYRYQIKARDASGNRSVASEIAESETAFLETLAMAAVSTPTSWTTGPSAGQDKVTMVATDDSATTYITTSTTINTQQQYTVNNPAAIVAADSIVNVRIHTVARKTATQATTMVLTGVVGANTLASNNCTLTTQNVWQTCTFDMATPPQTVPGTNAWTLTNLQDLQVRVHNSASRVVQVTYLSVIVTYVADAKPRPPVLTSATVLSATSIRLNWDPPTTNSDGSAIGTDLDKIRIMFCHTPSCNPMADGEAITPDFEETDVEYDHTGLTTGDTYWYAAYALDTATQLSNSSQLVWATPSEFVPDLAASGFQFFKAAQAEMQAYGAANTTTRVRRSGSVRLTIQVTNSGANTGSSATWPLECNVAGAAYATLTNTCADPGVCLRDVGGYAHATTLPQQLPTPEGYTFMSGLTVMNETWPQLGVNENRFIEMTYELGVTGLTLGDLVCCRPTDMDIDPGDFACFRAYNGSSRRE